MDAELDLTKVSRGTLLAVIGEQQATITQLQQRIGALEDRLRRRGSPGMPGNKPPTDRRPAKREPGKLRPHGFAWKRMEHAVEVRPDCGTHLVGGWVQRSREVIEISVVPIQVSQHAFVARICPVYERRQVPKGELKGMVLGHQRWGVNLVSLIVNLREEGRLPIRTIQWYLGTVHQLHLSVGASSRSSG